MAGVRETVKPTYDYHHRSVFLQYVSILKMIEDNSKMFATHGGERGIEECLLSVSQNML